MPDSITRFTIGWICAIGAERVVACELLDEEYGEEDDKVPSINPSLDPTIYSYGRIQKHNVVIASLPQSRYGIASAARIAARMRSTFPTLKLLLMVGIAGGVPSQKHDIRLGDVVVSCPTPEGSGVIQYDYGKTIQMREFLETRHLAPPSDIFLNAIGVLVTQHERRGHKIHSTISQMLKNNPRLVAKFSCPDTASDRLYDSTYVHLEQETCDCRIELDSFMGRSQRHLVQRHPRDSEVNPLVHYGLIASADQLMKDAITRDALAHKYDVLCFETEAAGLVDGSLPCLIVRGIADYADSHKNDIWQGYAAATAASYAKELLNVMPHFVEDKSAPEYDSKVDGDRSNHLTARIPFPDGVTIEIGGRAFLPTPSTQEDIDIKLYLEDIRNVFSSNSKENQEEIINICLKLRKQVGRVQAAITAQRNASMQAHQENQLLYNCVSRCINLQPADAARSLSAVFSGSPDYCFERSNGFFPEEYSLQPIFKDRFILMGHEEVKRKDIGTIVMRYYCKIKPRRWRRVRIHARFEDEGNVPMIFPCNSVDYDEDMFLGNSSGVFSQLLEMVVRDLDSIQRATRLFVPMRWDAAHGVQIDYQKTKIEDDEEEMDLRDERNVLAKLRALNVTEYRESEFVTLTRIQSYCFYVANGKSTYMLYKARFTSEALGFQNGFKSFLDHMEKTQSLSGCIGMPSFEGIVLDDSMTSITGYLLEPDFIGFDKALALTRSQEYNIARNLREYWALQAVSAIQEAHARGQHNARLVPNISRNLDIQFQDPWASIAFLRDCDGRLPPEMRGKQDRTWTIETDIFQLGLILWRLSEQVPRSSAYFCTVAGCPTKPRYRCLEVHSNPISLPFTDKTSTTLRTVIEQCRQEKPERRPSAESVLQQLNELDIDHAQLPKQKMEFYTMLKDVAEQFRIGTVWCSECFTLCSHHFYHCSICASADFDLCPSCIKAGVYCWDETHELRRILVDSNGNSSEQLYVRPKDCPRMTSVV